MGMHAAKIIKAHKLVESVPGISEPVRIAVHRWISHMQMNGMADVLPECLKKNTMLALEEIAKDGNYSVIRAIVPYFSYLLVEELQKAITQYRELHGQTKGTCHD